MKSTMDESQWQNMMVNCLQILRWNQNFRNSGEMRRQVTFEIWIQINFFVTVSKCDGESPSKIKTIMNMLQISKQWHILHLHHQQNCEILCRFFALGLHTLNSSQHIAGTYKIKLTQAKFKGGRGVPSQFQFFVIFYCIQHCSAISW